MHFDPQRQAAAWHSKLRTRRARKARALVAVLTAAPLVLVYFAFHPRFSSPPPAPPVACKTFSLGLTGARWPQRLLDMEEVGGVNLVSLVGTVPATRPGEHNVTGALRILTKALLLRDGRTILRGMLFLDHPDGVGETSNPPWLSSLPLEIRVYDAAVYGHVGVQASRMPNQIPPRRVALYGTYCPYGVRSKKGDVHECWSSDAPDRPRGASTNFLEFRVDLGRLGQDLADPEERPNVGVWLSVRGWRKGVDLTRQVASPEIADVGAVLDDEGEAGEIPETVRGRAAASSLASSVAGSSAGAWPFAYDKTTFGRSEKATAVLFLTAANASSYELPKSAPFHFSIDDYLLAKKTGDKAFVAAYEAATRPSVDVAPYVPFRYAPGREPARRLVQVWTYVYTPRPWYPTLFPRLVEHFLLNGGSAVMLYVSTEFGRELLTNPTVVAMVDAGVLALVRWKSLSGRIGISSVDHNVIGAHSALANWGRNVVLAKTDMDELVALPPRPWANQSAIRGAQFEALRGDNFGEVGRLGTVEYGREVPRSEELWTSLVRGEDVELRKLRELQAARPGRDPRALFGVGGVLAGRTGGYFAAETNIYAVHRAADNARRGSAYADDKGKEPASGRFLELFSPEDQLAPLTPRQRRVARILGSDGCLHQSAKLAQSKRDKTAPGLAKALRRPRCGIFHCLPTLFREGDPENPTFDDGRRIAAAPSMAAAMAAPLAAPIEFNWRKPAYDPDAVAGSTVHWTFECLGGRTQAWGRPPPGGVGVPLPIRKRADGFWNLEEVGLPQSLATNATLPPRIESACRIKRECMYFPYSCLTARHFVNLNSVRSKRDDLKAIVTNDWLWPYHEADPTRPFSSVQ